MVQYDDWPGRSDTAPSAAHGELQKKMVEYLATHGPVTISNLQRGLRKRSYPPTFVAFKALRRAGLLRPVGEEFVNGRRFPTFWLTWTGVRVALDRGIDPVKLQNLVDRVIPEEEAMRLEVGMTPRPSDWYNLAIEVHKEYGMRKGPSFGISKDADPEMAFWRLYYFASLAENSPDTSIVQSMLSEEASMFARVLRKFPGDQKMVIRGLEALLGALKQKS